MATYTAAFFSAYKTTDESAFTTAYRATLTTANKAAH
jgi:hypothetical protein